MNNDAAVFALFALVLAFPVGLLLAPLVMWVEERIDDWLGGEK